MADPIYINIAKAYPEKRRYLPYETLIQQSSPHTPDTTVTENDLAALM